MLNLSCILEEAKKPSMRVTNMATGGGGVPYPALQQAERRHAQEAPTQPPEAPKAEESPQEEEEQEQKKKPSSPSQGLGAALLHGCIGDFYRAVEGVTNLLTDVELTLPQIVVIGQESSGKSSVLESVAMLPLFPRDSDLCTRMPILLKLRNMSHGNVEVKGDPELMPHCTQSTTEQQIKIRLIYSDTRAPIESERIFTPQEAAQLMSKWMQQIVKDEHDDNKLKGVVDHVLEIEVRSCKVPNLNLIDLPGIVAGKLIDEPDDMMQRTRALVEKYLQMPNTVVLAVVPAFERVRNSQAFQLVQQYKLIDKTIGVLTMVDRAMDETNPDGPLAEVMSRLDGTSQDLIYLKHGYVAVKNRDARATPELSLEQSKEEENAWFEKNLPGYIDRCIASSTALVTKLERRLAEYVRETWVLQTLSKIESRRRKTENKLASFGPDAQDIANAFRGVAPTVARKQMLQLITPILPQLMGQVDEEMICLMTLVHADFLQSREEHALILAPFRAKKKQNGSLVAASMVMLDSHETYIADHLVQILKNVVLHVVNLIQKIIATSPVSDIKETTSQRLDRFPNFHYFFAGVLWERLNELLIDEECLLESLKRSFLKFDPENAAILQMPTRIKMMHSKAGEELKSLACGLELYLDSVGFQNTSIDEVYLPSKSQAETSLSRDISRLIVGAQVPTLKKSNPHGFGAANPVPEDCGFSFGTGFASKGFTFPELEEVDEFESRLFFAISSHVVAPLLQSICDVSDLARRVQEYVSCFPKVTVSNTHIFHDSTSEKRRRLKKLMKRLDVTAAEVKLTAQ